MERKLVTLMMLLRAARPRRVKLWLAVLAAIAFAPRLVSADPETGRRPAARVRELAVLERVDDKLGDEVERSRAVAHEAQCARVDDVTGDRRERQLLNGIRREAHLSRVLDKKGDQEEKTRFLQAETLTRLRNLQRGNFNRGVDVQGDLSQDPRSALEHRKREELRATSSDVQNERTRERATNRREDRERSREDARGERGLQRQDNREEKREERAERQKDERAEKRDERVDEKKADRDERQKDAAKDRQDDRADRLNDARQARDDATSTSGASKP